MLIGLIADTHDNIPQIKRACELFNDRGVREVLHAGDYVAPFSLNPLNEILQCNYRGVFGNNDGERLGLQKTAQGRLVPSPTVLKVDKWEIVLAHELPFLEPLLASNRYRLIVYGHTHRPESRRLGDAVVVNPGECSGWLTGTSTIALVDLITLEVEIVQL